MKGFGRYRDLVDVFKPAAKKILYRAAAPGLVGRFLYARAHDAIWASRELSEWAWRSLVATPMFLSWCTRYGENISVDRVPYYTGRCRIEIGSDLRVSGQLGITSPTSRKGSLPLLKIGSSVFIGHASTLVVAHQVEIGNFVSIGNGTFITDTDGHSHARLDVPSWEDPPGPQSIGAVIIEDNVHINRHCMILRGVRVGARSIIGAGSVVRGDVPPDSIVMGNPARVVSFRRGTRPLAAVPTIAPSRTPAIAAFEPK